jgi:TonB family protein
VSLSFHLHPDGHLSEIKIVHGSGFKVLDEEALSALLAIVPFTIARAYLRSTKLFTIDVIFE